MLSSLVWASEGGPETFDDKFYDNLLLEINSAESLSGTNQPTPPNQPDFSSIEKDLAEADAVISGMLLDEATRIPSQFTETEINRDSEDSIAKLETFLSEHKNEQAIATTAIVPVTTSKNEKNSAKIELIGFLSNQLQRDIPTSIPHKELSKLIKEMYLQSHPDRNPNTGADQFIKLRELVSKLGQPTEKKLTNKSPLLLKKNTANENKNLKRKRSEDNDVQMMPYKKMRLSPIVNLAPRAPKMSMKQVVQNLKKRQWSWWSFLNPHLHGRKHPLFLCSNHNIYQSLPGGRIQAISSERAVGAGVFSSLFPWWGRKKFTPAIFNAKEPTSKNIAKLLSSYAKSPITCNAIKPPPRLGFIKRGINWFSRLVHRVITAPFEIFGQNRKKEMCIRPAV